MATLASHASQETRFVRHSTNKMATEAILDNSSGKAGKSHPKKTQVSASNVALMNMDDFGKTKRKTRKKDQARMKTFLDSFEDKTVGSAGEEHVTSNMASSSSPGTDAAVDVCLGDVDVVTPGDDYEFGEKKKKPKSKTLSELLNEEPEDPCDVSDGLYSYNQLLAQCQSVKKVEPVQKLRISIPVVFKSGRMRTTFVNFLETANKFHRSPHHMLSFFNSELGTKCSVCSTNQLWIRGNFRMHHIEKLLKDYAEKYVLCPACRSPATILQKRERLTFLSCDRCDASFSVGNIIEGYRSRICVR